MPPYLGGALQHSPDDSYTHTMVSPRQPTSRRTALGKTKYYSQTRNPSPACSRESRTESIRSVRIRVVPALHAARGAGHRWQVPRLDHGYDTIRYGTVRASPAEFCLLLPRKTVHRSMDSNMSVPVRVSRNGITHVRTDLCA